MVTTEIATTFEQLLEGFSISRARLATAGRFIEFFVDDILDYTVLNNDEPKFIKNMEVFDLKHAFNEIQQMLEEKIALKKIKVICSYQAFRSNRYVKTDQKRL